MLIRYLIRRYKSPVLVLGLLSFVLCVIPSLRLVEARPVTRAVGVKAGDTVRYGEFLALWHSFDPGASVPRGLLDANNTLWVENTVLNASGTIVFYNVTTYYKNGTRNVDVAHIDVGSGVGSRNMSYVSTGLAVGDSVYASGDFADYRINSTSLRGYVGLMRGAHLLNVTYSSVGVNASEIQWNEFYWDSTTGVLVEQFWSFAGIDDIGYLTAESVVFKMISNDIWMNVPDGVPPVAAAGPDRTVDQGMNVSFDGGGSRDDVGIKSFGWDFGDGASSKGLQVFHVFDRVGVFNVTLTVEDSAGHTVSDVLVVTVEQVSEGFSLWWLMPVGLIVLLLILVSLWLFSGSRRRESRRSCTRMRR